MTVRRLTAACVISTAVWAGIVLAAGHAFDVMHDPAAGLASNTVWFNPAAELDCSQVVDLRFVDTGMDG